MPVLLWSAVVPLSPLAIAGGWLTTIALVIVVGLLASLASDTPTAKLPMVPRAERDRFRLHAELIGHDPTKLWRSELIEVARDYLRLVGRDDVDPAGLCLCAAVDVMDDEDDERRVTRRARRR